MEVTVLELKGGSLIVITFKGGSLQRFWNFFGAASINWK
jgi:hypothetical protein